MKNILRLLSGICCAVLLFASCQKEYSNESGIAQVAAGSLKDSTGNCLPDSVIGTYYDGITPGSDTAYVEVQVNVTKTGSYSIATDLQNGFLFSDSGYFTSTGINVIRLKPIGTPTFPKASVFTVSFDSSFCSFTVNVQDSTGTGIHSGGDTVGSGDPDAGAGDWMFTSNGNTYKGSGLSTENLDTLGQHFLIVESDGFNVDTLLTIVLPVSSSNITTGSYNTSSTTVLSGLELDDLTSGDQLYKADYTTTNASLTIKILSYDASAKLLVGSFSGTAIDKNGKVQTITNGSFSVVVQ